MIKKMIKVLGINDVKPLKYVTQLHNAPFLKSNSNFAQKTRDTKR